MKVRVSTFAVLPGVIMQNSQIRWPMLLHIHLGGRKSEFTSKESVSYIIDLPKICPKLNPAR